MAKKKKGYQRGRTVNPRAAGAAAMRRNAPPVRPPIVQGNNPFGVDAPVRPPIPGGWAAGGVVENYNDQVKRKYGGGKL